VRSGAVNGNVRPFLFFVDPGSSLILHRRKALDRVTWKEFVQYSLPTWSSIGMMLLRTALRSRSSLRLDFLAFANARDAGSRSIPVREIPLVEWFL
jgi:hypothetical protein